MTNLVETSIPRTGTLLDPRIVASADEYPIPLREERLAEQRLFALQPSATQELLEAQFIRMADALLRKGRKLDFILPDQILFFDELDGGPFPIPVPREFHRQVISNPLPWKREYDLRAALRRRLSQLEQSPFPGVNGAGRMIRFGLARHLIYTRLPAIQKLASNETPTSAFSTEWSAFQHGQLTVPTLAEAEARIARMQNYLAVLAMAISLAPYFFSDETYQGKRTSMLAQLIPQGYALATHQVQQIIEKLRSLSDAHQLDRGLRLSIPYFHDSSLAMKSHSFEVIPTGFTPFIPAFLVLAVEQEIRHVEEDPTLATVTRVHLLELLKTMEYAFQPGETNPEIRKGTQ
jgi:hypothetical protein